jgi:hypothetical protein
MFISNKRLVKPSQIKYEKENIQVVKKFKLLGIIIDDKLQFIEHVSNQCLMINKRLYSISRLFYLPFDVKIHFFKSFILPFFDYAISLAVYFHKTALKKLCKIYYLCLYKLFKFKFANLDSKKINDYLVSVNLFSFHHRLTFRTIMFLNNIIHDKCAPEHLKILLKKVNIVNHCYKLRIK